MAWTNQVESANESRESPAGSAKMFMDSPIRVGKLAWTNLVESAKES